jgi:hypothetical protein
MVIPRRHLRSVLCCAGFVALLLVIGSLRPGTASAKPYTWTDLGPIGGSSGDPTGDDQPSPTPKPSKAASYHPREGSMGVEPALRGFGRFTILWTAYRQLLWNVPRF